MYSILCKFSLLVIFTNAILCNESESSTCPAKCTCKRNSQTKMKCGDKDKVSHLDELELLNYATDLVQLNLSDNLLKSFTIQVELSALQKLDLSRNQLTSLKEDQFIEVPNLRRLDISGNNIKEIHITAFNQLEHLERLKLNHNQITSIANGTFDPLINLKQLDISNNPLICDCGLLWMLDWSQKSSLKLVSNPKCASPPTFKGFALRKLKIGEDIHCKSPAITSGLAIIDLKPNENQVVFEGDLLRMRCKAPSITDSPENGRLNWLWSDSDPKLHFNVSIEHQHLPSTGIIESTLTITRLQRNHSGLWTCLLNSTQGNHSKGITIVVINDETKYCPSTVTSNNKGTYNWPRTVVNNTVTVTCESLNHNYDVRPQSASYTCTQDGAWSLLNTSNCQYTSDTTKILQQYAMINLTMLETEILSSVQHFREYISNGTILKDAMDFVFAVNTIEIYAQQANSPVNAVLIDVVNSLIQLPRWYLRQADLIQGSLKKLRNSSEQLALSVLPTTNHKSNIAIEVFAMEKESFNGMKCTWYVNVEDVGDKWFSCNTNSDRDVGLHGKRIEASITIPASLFRQLDEKEIVDKANIFIAMHVNSNLFAIDRERDGREDVTSSVVGAKLLEMTIDNLTDPIFVMVRTPPSLAYEVTPFEPVRWDERLNNGSGMWTSNGCKFSHQLSEHVVFSCNNFGYFGLLQDISHMKSLEINAKFKLSNASIYVGSFILFISLFVCILTYLFCYKSIQMPKKAKHSLINMWISILMLCFMYVFGIYQTEDVRLCEIVGMILHYFTLCTLLWMCVGVNCMYKRLTKNNEIGLSDDNLPSDQPIQKPILGLYLVGWGVALIICGLSAAINIREYSSPNHCFLRTGPALSALYIPFGILTVFLSIFFLLIRCAIYNLDTNGHLSEGTQATEHVDLDLLEPNFPHSSTRSLSTKTTTEDEIEDPEHAPSAQLKAHMIYFLLYVMTWLSCAFATTSPFHLISKEEDMFSISFAILSTTLSAFTLFFYCVARNDVRTKWMEWCRWVKRKHFRSRNISDTTPQITSVQIQPAVVNVPLEMAVTSRTSSRASSNHTKSNSHNSNILKGAVDLNGSFSDCGAKINNVNLIVLHRAQYRTSVIPNIIENPTNAAEVFYNPHQSIVARKFFKRQKRNMLKKNNLTQRPRDLNSDTASVFSDKTTKDMFSTNSKVNNTNIHVECVNATPQKNPNLLEVNNEDFCRKKETNRSKVRKKHNNRKQKTAEEFNSSENSDLEGPKSNVLQDETITKDVSDTSSIHYFYEEDYGTGTVRRRPKKCDEILQPSEDSCSGTNESVARIYVNPSHDFLLERKNGTQSRGSSVSVSDLDELYQQIRRGPKIAYKNDRKRGGIGCLSDSEVTSYVSNVKFVTNGEETVASSCSDDIETTV